jgi:hypothetical protein
MKLSEYYIYAIIFSVFLIILFLSLAPLAPINEPLYYSSYNLFLPVGVSFSAALAFFSFLILFILFSDTKNIWLSIIIDSLALTFSFLNYVNIYVIWSIWKPHITPLPFFILITYYNASSLWLDFGQIVLAIFFYRLYKKIKSSKMPRPLSEPDTRAQSGLMRVLSRAGYIMMRSTYSEQ